MLDTGCWMWRLCRHHAISVAGCWILDNGYWYSHSSFNILHWPRLDVPSVMLHSTFILSTSAQFVIRHLARSATKPKAWQYSPIKKGYLTAAF